MIKEIKYNGFSANPSDYECPDGDLAASIGAILEDGALKPVLPPSEVLRLKDGAIVLFVHKTASYKHYIIRINDTISWFTVTDGIASTPIAISGTYDTSRVNSINAIGNTLLMLTEDSIRYYLWKQDGYAFLGDHLPNVELSFGLKGRPLLYSKCGDNASTFKITFNKVSRDDIFLEWSQELQNQITPQVMAKVNKFLADQTVNKGRFCMPFFVRYALRLYDGSLTCHSAPILMNPSTKTAPVVLWNRIDGADSHAEAECDIMLVSASLDYNPYNIDKVYDWTDIVKSIDVFISKPIYTYNQDGLCTSFMETGDMDDTKFIGTLDMYSSDWGVGGIENLQLNNVYEDKNILPVGYSIPGQLHLEYLEWKYSDLYVIYYSKKRSYPNTSIRLPELSEEKLGEQLKNASAFYLLHSISMDELKLYGQNPGYHNNNLDIVVPDDYLQSLLAREVMTDDYMSHDRLMADFSHVYNSRINLAGVKRMLYDGFSPASLFARTTIDRPSIITGDNVYGKMVNIIYPYNDRSIDTYIDVYIKENGDTYHVRSKAEAHNMAHYLSVTRYPVKEDGTTDTADGYLVKNSWGCYVFYPNAGAFKMRITDNLGSYDISLKPHDFLNGAYALLDYEQERTPQTSYTEVSSSDNIIDIPNKLYTSEVNNPFVFPLLGINTIGTGRIIGISSAVKALSEGQFGQFPLYAFTSEGVWAMEVSQTGTYSAKQPVTRDVCINPDSITQIDSAVLFATNRGIMHISGSTTQCITESVNAPKLYGLTDLPKNEVLVSLFNDRAHDYEQFTSADTIFLPFLDFLADCRMVYDYTHQRIIVYNPSVRYAYIYSFKSQAWGMMLSDIKSNVNSYPEALVMSSKKITIIGDDGQETTSTASVLQDFTATEADDATALIITRPFKMDDPDMFKTIDTIIQRGVFKSENVLQVLYASNDLYHWLTVWSSKDKYMRGFRGTPHKAFRLALVVNLAKGESLYGCTVQFRPRMLDQPR